MSNELIVELPSSRVLEREYIWNVLLGEGLGLNVKYEIGEGRATAIRCVGLPGAIAIQDILLSCSQYDWLNERSMPIKPLERLALPKSLQCDIGPDVIAIYGEGAAARPALATSDDGLVVNFDLGGSAFFMLTRYEELILKERDAHGRIPSSAMLMVAEGSHKRAVVNEYLVLLAHAIHLLWPMIQMSRRDYRALVSHDVDSALYLNRATLSDLSRAVLGDVFWRRDIGLATRRALTVALKSIPGVAERDVYNTYDLLMDISESHGLKSAFYFICGGSVDHDGDYLISSPWCLDLLGRIAARGHEIGIHASYSSGDTDGCVRTEFDALLGATSRSGIRQALWGGRHHYLRWSPQRSWREWAAAGLSYDSSLGFADMAGFRTGYCFEYPVFDLVSGTALPLRERPLVVMEKTIFPDHPSEKSESLALELCQELVGTCKRFGGDFTMLWHNSKLCSRRQIAVYKDILNAVVR